jgi:hypothetical protein
MIDPPELTTAEMKAWRPALKAAYAARGIKNQPKRLFSPHDRWNVKCLRAARALMPDEKP